MTASSSNNDRGIKLAAFWSLFLRLFLGWQLKQRARGLSGERLRRVFFLVLRHPPLCWLSVADDAASRAPSASCDQRPEHVGVVAMVVPEGELGDVHREILLRHLMV